MSRALELAQRGWFTTRTNPRVGCVLVKNDVIIGEGWHEQPGLAHAEVNAILNAKQNHHDTAGATAYVTLEPCSHTGKTPPCAEALIEAQISRVICAMQDPNKRVSGRGFERLRAAGIDVQYGLLEDQAHELNRGFIHRMLHNKPLVTAKIAMSLDGKIAMASGESQWITSKDSRNDVQRLRAQSGAVLTGSGTVIADNPSLNVRDERFISQPYFGQPLRVVIDSQRQVPSDAAIWSQSGNCWWITQPGSATTKTTQNPNVCEKDIVSPETTKVNLEQLLSELAEEGVNDVLLEAGSHLIGAFIEQQLIDELVVYMAPKIMGSTAQGAVNVSLDTMSQAVQLELKESTAIGSDLRLHYKVHY